MIPLLSEAGRRELQRLAAARTLYAFDFDGTLAPIVADPGAARADDAVMGSLAELARYAPVAIVSGRACADLRRRIGIDVHYLVGNHGNEGLPGGAELEQLQAIVAGWRDTLERELTAGSAVGVVLEDKQRSLSLHYRASSQPQQALAQLRAIIGRLQPPPEIIEGKMVLNLLPPGSVTKYEALQALVERERADALFFAGDDVTDEVVFERAPPHWTTVRIEPVGASAARFELEAQAQIGAVLHELVAAHMSRDPARSPR